MQLCTPLGGELAANAGRAEDWSNVITPIAPSYDTSNRVILHALSAVSKRLLQMSLTELSYSSQVYQRLLHFR